MSAYLDKIAARNREKERKSEVLWGWREIAEFLGLSSSTIRAQKDELLSRGIIFYRRRRPGCKVVCAWPQKLRAWNR